MQATVLPFDDRSPSISTSAEARGTCSAGEGPLRLKT
jgi:hypothetical protein